jgi:hypothetical protein
LTGRDSFNAFNHLAKACRKDVSLSLAEVMETAMRLPLTVIAGLLSVSSPAVAEPPKADAARSAQPQERPAQVVLASADAVHAPAPDRAQPTPAPAKRRIGRVTTCRCGDPQPGADSQEQ